MDPTSLVPLTALIAKLIGVGIDAWKAADAEGWGVEEATAFEKALAVVPGFAALRKQGPSSAPLVEYCELVTVAFGDAWRRHWYYDANLAPTSSITRLWDRLRGKPKADRIRQLQRRLEEGRFTALPLGDGAALNEIELLEQLQEPLRSPWYDSLWRAFNGASPAEDGELPPLLVLERNGDSKAEFERHFKVAFNEALTTPRGERLRRWLEQQQGPGGDHVLLLRRLLTARLSQFRTEHLFGETGSTSQLPLLPLQDLYVEPRARRRHFADHRNAEGKLDGALPVLDQLRALLADEQTRIVLVLADFGRGKSLTARTLAYQLAEQFLSDTEHSSLNVNYPIFVRCQSSLRPDKLPADAAARAAQKGLLEPLLRSVKTDDPALGLHSRQRTLVLLDGLDEVQLSERDATDLFKRLKDEANAEHRVIVFSRSPAVPADIREWPGVAVLELQDFEDERQLWLEKWQALAPAPHPTVTDLQDHNLAELCKVPVLLFMVAHTWGKLADKQTVQRTDVYDEFILLTARSKLEHDEKKHPVVFRAAKSLLTTLVRAGDLANDAKPEHALVEILSRIAWVSHKNGANNKRLTSLDVHKLLGELKVEGDELKMLEHGVLLTLSVSLTSTGDEIQFTHRSFQEFLVAKYWETRLRRAINAEEDDRREIEEQLYGARLIQEDDQSHLFLAELCQRWSAEERARLQRWAQDTFNDETLSAYTLRGDQRYALREAAVFIGSAVAATGLRAKHKFTLGTLLASYSARAQLLQLRAPGLQHAHAQLLSANLSRADLSDANLDDADLTGASLVRTILSGANLSRANLSNSVLISTRLSGANLSRANLNGANLNGVRLGGANLARANLARANVARADLSNADLSDADLGGAYLVAANLSRANLSDANLDDADLRGANLSDASHLTQAQLKHALGNPETRLPADIRRPNHWSR